ncbi:MAG: FtsX-like permease family protein [Luteitalea sp.]|nr:FtsX-like permease family protein [Luteitalea sp.]
MWIGAQRGDVLSLILREALRVVLVGIVIGIGGALIATKLVANLLYGVEPRDPLTIALAVAVMLAVALGTALFPARRAARVDPVTSLRYE